MQAEGTRAASAFTACARPWEDQGGMSTPTDHQKGRGGQGAACTRISRQGGSRSLERVSACIAFKGAHTNKQATARILQASTPDRKCTRPWLMGETGFSPSGPVGSLGLSNTQYAEQGGSPPDSPALYSNLEGPQPSPSLTDSMNLAFFRPLRPSLLSHLLWTSARSHLHPQITLASSPT